MRYKILLISSGQPSLNPRLVKEADALADAGYEVTVLYAYWNDWGTKFDEKLIPTKKWTAICSGGDPQGSRTTYFISRLIHKAARLVNKATVGKYQAELAIARSSYFLMRAARSYHADLYIGHNLGALPATVKAAKANKKPCGFDAEDFHRFETSDDKTDAEVILKTRTEDYYFPQINYLTASSPLIAEAYQKLFPDKDPIVIRNVFPLDFGIRKPELNADAPIRLFWFSQTIGAGRGIETVLKALQLLKEKPFELHLLGHISEGSAELFSNTEQVSIHFHMPVPPNEITAFASQFDIGLASENSIPLNRDICLTNKIFTCILAGLAVVASDTSAQVQLFQQYPGIGKIYRQDDPQSLADVLLDYHRHRENLLEARKAALALGMAELNWESEQEKLLALVENTLNKH